MEITSATARVNAPAEEIYEFLTDAANIELLLPAKDISDFKSDEEGCSFKVQGGILIPLIYSHQTPYELIEMKSNDKAPFPYKLAIVIDDMGDYTEGHIEFEGEVNFFLKMMVAKPLESLFNTMTEKLQEQFQ